MSNTQWGTDSESSHTRLYTLVLGRDAGGFLSVKPIIKKPIVNKTVVKRTVVKRTRKPKQETKIEE